MAFSQAVKNVGQPTVVELNSIKQYQTELSLVGFISYCDDDSLWISSTPDEVLQRVKPEGTKLNKLFSFNIKVCGMTATQSNNLLMTTGEYRLKQISSNAGTLTDSVCNMSPFRPTAIHITSDNKVLVIGGCTGRRVVILMNQNGDHERVYEHDQHKQPLFTCPRIITSTSNGNIHVVDIESDDRGRVVVLRPGGDIIHIYTVDKEINKDMQFSPTDIVTTPGDNVIVSDPVTSTLHILNNAGLLMTYYKTSDINILYPYSLEFSPTGKLYIGCSTPGVSTTNNAKIYEVTISGC